MGQGTKAPSFPRLFLAFFLTLIQKKGRVEGRGAQEHLNIRSGKAFNVERACID